MSRVVAAFVIVGLASCSDKQTPVEVPPTDSFPVVPELHGPGLPTGKYAIASIAIEVARTKADGKSWDGAGGDKPDPAIVVLVDGTIVDECETVSDQFLASCEPDEVFDLTEATHIELRVVDADLSSDDPIGAASLRGIQRSGAASTPLPMATNGQLRSAKVVLVSAEPVTRFWYRHKFRVIGGVAGILGALVLLVLFRRRLLAPECDIGNVLGEVSGSGDVEVADDKLPSWRRPAIFLALLLAFIGLLSGFVILAGDVSNRPLIVAQIGFATMALLFAISDIVVCRRIDRYRLGAVSLSIGAFMPLVVGAIIAGVVILLFIAAVFEEYLL